MTARDYRVAVATDPARSTQELGNALSDGDWGAVLVMASPRHELGQLVNRVAEAARTEAVIGVTTAGEFAMGRALGGTAVVVGIPRTVCPVASVTLLEGLEDRSQVTSALGRVAAGIGLSPAQLSVDGHAGIVLPTGMCEREERLMEYLGDASDISFVGGTAGDDLCFKSTEVAIPGKTSRTTAALLLLDLPAGHRVIKTQSFRRTGTFVTPTRVEGRRVFEFDGQPAVKRYAQAMGCSPDQVLDRFYTHPLGLMVDDEPFVRTSHIVEGESLVFFCNLTAGIPLELLELGDVVEVTREALAADRAEFGSPSALLDFDCVSRRVHLEKLGQLAEYAALYEGPAHAGFSTYGEQYLGHMNQTAVLLALA